jgi:hypothetical protein
VHNGTCRGCGHPVTFAGAEDGATLVLERHETAAGAGRYAVFDDGIARPVPASREVLAYPLHVCAALDRLRREGAVAKDYVAR